MITNFCDKPLYLLPDNQWQLVITQKASTIYFLFYKESHNLQLLVINTLHHQPQTSLLNAMGAMHL